MKDLLNTVIFIYNKKDWNKVLLIYNSYTKNKIYFEWRDNSVCQYFRIAQDYSYIGWNPFTYSDNFDKEYIIEEYCLKDYKEIFLNDYLKY